MEGNQGRAAGGIDGDRGPLQPKRVGDAARRDACGVADTNESFKVRWRSNPARNVVVIHDADEDAGWGAVEGGGGDAGALEGFPGGLEKEAVLGVDGQGLARADAEECGVE